MDSKDFKFYLSEYFHAMVHIPELLHRIPFRTRTLEEELHEAMLRGNLRKAFRRLDLLLLGLSVVIGSGVFVLSGVAAADFAGPAVILSYTISGLASLCAAACYAELCVEYPVSGGAFTYIMVTFGEFPAFLTVGNLIIEWMLGMGAVARGFSKYLASLCGQPQTLFTIETGGLILDFMAMGIVLVVTGLLTFGMKESAFFISGTTLIKLLVLLFVIIVGFTQVGDGSLDPFTLPDKSADGVLEGAAYVFFSFVGFDAICNAAEEAEDIRHLPVAVIGTVIGSWVVYFLMALTLVLMVPIPEEQPGVYNSNYDAYTDAPFSYAFRAVGLKWMTYVVSVGALLGIVTSLIAGLFSLSRLVMVASRDWLLPPQLSRISPKTQTPLIAQLVIGALVSVVALIVKFTTLSQIVSFGTLFAMWAVCNAMLYRRYYPDVKVRFTRYGTVEATEAKILGKVPGALLSETARQFMLWFHLIAINAATFAFTTYYHLTFGDNGRHDSLATMWFVGAWLLLTISMQLWCPLQYEPKGWKMPWWCLPWVPSLAIMLIALSLGSFEADTYIIVMCYFIGLVGFYLLFSLPMSYIKHYKLEAPTNDDLRVVEMVYVPEMGWQPAMQLGTSYSTTSSTLNPSIGGKVRLPVKPSLSPMMLGATTSSGLSMLTSSDQQSSGQPGESKLDKRASIDENEAS